MQAVARQMIQQGSGGKIVNTALSPASSLSRLSCITGSARPA
jgi:hypothetical protein